MRYQFFRLLIILSIFIGFDLKAISNEQLPIDKNATKETIALYRYLHRISGHAILFGHQHATEYGHGWWGDSNRSDVKSVAGSHPAIIGIDFSGLSGQPDSLIKTEENRLRKIIQETYARDGIITISWHFYNPLSDGGFYWKDGVSVASIPRLIPGASDHEIYKSIVTRISKFIHSVKGKKGEPIPMIFRPFHELDGSWFWWGKSHCSPDEIKTLWKFTVNYMRDSMKVHQLLYAFSPDCTFSSEAEFLERYPGDDYADLVGMDNYADFGRDGKYNLPAAVKKLQIVQNYANKAGKLTALTETGLESIPKADWWTEVLLKTITAPGLQLAYVLVWRNDVKSATHYYAPFPGHASVSDFLKFYNSPLTLFEKDLKNIYKP
jgi:mannan endo-1,4-beta-mannosidase